MTEAEARKLIAKSEIYDAALVATILDECRDESEWSAPRLDANRGQDDKHQIEPKDSSYHPFSLELCCETANRMRDDNRLPSAKDFALKTHERQAKQSEIHDQIIGRYLNSLPKKERKIIYKLAFTLQFDQDAALAAFFTDPHFKGARETDVDERDELLLRNYISSRRQGEAGQWFALSGNLRRHILASVPVFLKDVDFESAKSDFNAQKAHEFWEAYWEARKPSDWWERLLKRPKSKVDIFARLAWFHRWHTQREVAWEEWEKLVTDAREGAQPDVNLELLGWWDMTDIKERKPRDEFEADVLLNVADEYRLADESFSISLSIQRVQLLRLTLLYELIDCSERALEFFTKNDHVEKWARAQHRKGSGYGRMVQLTIVSEAERLEHISEALVCYDFALQARTPQHYAKGWAETQYAKGLAHYETSQLTIVSEVERLGPLNEALACFNLALQVRTQQNYPREWADTQYAKGLAHYETSRLTIVSEAERLGHLKEALSCYNLALQVRNPQHYPNGWADTQFNKGAAHDEIGRLTIVSEAERLGHLKEALSCYNLALQVRNPQHYPNGWADTQFNMAITEQRLGNKGAALACARQAIVVYSLADIPHRVEAAQRLLRQIQESMG